MHEQAFHLGVLVLMLVVLGEASLSKILARETPDWFRDQFQGSWLAKITPLPAMWWGIALVEFCLAGTFLGALVVFEFQAGTPNVLTEWGLIGSMFLFAGLCFGQRVTFDFVGAANSFFYAGFCAVLWFLVHQLR